MPLRAEPLLAILLLVSTSLNLWQLHDRRAQATRVELAAGAVLPPLAAATLEGQPVTIPVSGDLPTAIYVFSPECGWCERNRENVIELAAQMRGRYRFVGVSLSGRGLRDYLQKHPLPFPVYQDPAPETRHAYRLDATPQTMLVDRDGRLEQAWAGAYTEDLKRDIQAHLAARL